MPQINNSHSYLQQNYNVPTIPPPDSKLKGIKKFVARCIAFFTNAQNTFNANVVRTFDSFHIDLDKTEIKLAENEKLINKLKDSLKQLQIKIDKNNSYVDEIAEQNLKKQGELFDLFSQVNTATELLRDMQDHHGGVIAGFQKKVDANIELVSKAQDFIEDFISKLNKIKQSVSAFEEKQDIIAAQAKDLFEKTDARQDGLANKVNSLFKDLNARQDDLTKKVNTSFKKLNAREDNIGDNLKALAERVELSEKGFTELNGLMKEINDQTCLLKSSLNNALTDFSSDKDKSKLQASLGKLKDLWNDSDYTAFENAYRGDDKLIYERLNYYLKWLKKIKTTKQACILDLGCGRGEFVELLNNNKIHARGIDLNKTSVKLAKEKNLKVKHADLFKELKRIKQETLPAISAFHVIEHFNFKELQLFLQLAATRLKPGGILLLETPNALNLQIAASDFYKDPTHVRPVHPAAIEFWLKRSGFSKIELDFIHPFPKGEQLKKIKNSKLIDGNFNKLNDLVFGARDCAIIAKK